MLYLGAICEKFASYFGANLATQFKKDISRTSPSKGTI